jgi:predicted DNA-binding transcriptional regulator AlpA
MTIKLEDDELLSSAQTAALIGQSPRYFSEKFIFKSLDFPAAFRASERGQRKWLKSEVLAWLEQHREGAEA